MANLTRILRLRDAEIWGYEFLDKKEFIIYFSITDVNRKATTHDNPLATQEELDERDNYVSIDVHSNLDLKKTLEEDTFDDFITEISFLVEHMHDFHNAHVFMKIHVHDNIDWKMKICMVMKKNSFLHFNVYGFRRLAFN